MLFRKTLLWLLPLISVEAFAVQGGPELDRHLVSMYGEGEGEIWGQFDYVDDSFDIFGYGGTSSGINYSTGAMVGGKVALTDHLNVRAHYSRFEDEAWRLTEPKILKSDYQEIETQLQNVIYVGRDFDLALNIGFRSHSSQDGVINKFQFQDYLVESGGEAITVTDGSTGGWTQTIQNLGGGQVFVDGTLIQNTTIPLTLLGFDATVDSLDTSYLINATPTDEGVELGLSGAWYPASDYRLTLGGGVRQLEVEPNYRVNPDLMQLLEMYDTNASLQQLGNIDSSVIRAQLPQESGWDETHVVLSAGVDWDAYEDLSFAAEYTFYNISRSGYQSTQGKVAPGVEDQTTNHQLDGWLFIKPETDITLYIHGRAYSNFLLGDRPLLYNARVNHKFTDPYGFVSVGAVWEF